MSMEPILRAEDHRAWDQWMRSVCLHMRTQVFRRTVDAARRLTELALANSSRPSLSWSGGKDSTDLAHLVGVLCGAGSVKVHSEKDDLDYPGEEDYVRGLASAWGLDLTILRPPVSPSEWIARRAAHMSGGEDIHSRSAGLSKMCFYPVMEAATREHDLVFLGLRAEESGIRRNLRAARGRLYSLKSGQRRCIPISDWRGIDVYAYAEVHGFEFLPVYRCIGFLDELRLRPWLVRKSWWLPGVHAARQGQAAWLRRYYPSLWERFMAWFPDARSFA